jgi:hypothetical protein
MRLLEDTRVHRPSRIVDPIDRDEREQDTDEPAGSACDARSARSVVRGVQGPPMVLVGPAFRETSGLARRARLETTDATWTMGSCSSARAPCDRPHARMR